MVFLLGLGLAAVGALDVALLFYPADWSSLNWEFGTVSGFIDGLPLMTMGFGAMVVASTSLGWAKWRRLLSIVALLIALMVMVNVLVFALDVPAALRAVSSPVMKTVVKKAVLKTGSMGVVYVALYAALGVWTWRRLKSLKGASR
jgi:hypothetical protein